MVTKSSFEVARELRRIIDSGEWDAGGRLPPERILASRFAVARNTLRRALDELETSGYLSRQVGRGTFVTRRKSRKDDGFIFSMIEASPRDLLETRLIIEPHAAALAAKRASGADLDTISGAFEQSLAATDITRFETYDAQLHLAVFLAAKNEVLIDYCRAISEARNQPQWFELKKRSLTHEKRAIYDEQHRLLVNALLERNAEAAAQNMRLHLDSVANDILAVV